MRHHHRQFHGVSGLTALLACASLAANAQISVLTRSYNSQRTGSNPVETILNTSNVSVGAFGKLFSRTTDGNVYAQPLYVPTLSIGGKTHNVLFVATMHDTVYAYDADDPAASAPLWKTSYLTTSDGIHPPAVTTTTIPTTDFFSTYKDISTEMGILSTPVIDPATNTMYVLVRTKEVGGANGTYVQRLHALDITTGYDKQAAVVISASVSGTGSGSKNGKLTFDPKLQNQRAALLLDHGKIYLAWASQGDNGNYHGWVMAYDAATLTQKGVFCSTPNGSQGGIWQSGQGLTADAAGNVYCVVGNGDNSIKTGGTGYGNAILKLTPGPSTLTVADWFMPYNTTALNNADLDTECGVVLLPGNNGITNAMFGGKDGYFYMVNTANMGHYNPANAGAPQNDNQIIQSFQVSNQHIHGSPALWYGPNGVSAFLWAEYSWLKGFNFVSEAGAFTSTPVTQSTFADPNGMPGGFITVSSNGSQPGTGIVWVNLPYTGNANQAVVPGVLRAFDASDLTHELWNSRANLARDDFGNFGKFCPPTVANGKVYMATFSNQVAVYGLLPVPVIPDAPTIAATVSGVTATISWTNVAGAATYTVQRAASASGPYTTLTTTLASSPYSDATLAPGTAYFYTVAAVNSVGSSAPSAPASITTAPATPAGLAAYPGDSNVALVWNPVPGAASYTLLRAKGSGGSYLPLASGVTFAGYSDTTVTNGISYTYILNAVGAGGSSPYSAPANAIPAPLLPGQTVTIAGQVALEQSFNLAQTMTLQFRPTDGTGPITQTAQLDANGRFSISGMAAKSYDIAIKGSIWLQQVTPVDASLGSVTTVTASLLTGDSNNDNSVDSSDFGILIGAFGSVAAIPGSGYDPAADFNCDGLIDSTDFGLLIGNFGTQGDN